MGCENLIDEKYVEVKIGILVLKKCIEVIIGLLVLENYIEVIIAFLVLEKYVEVIITFLVLEKYVEVITELLVLEKYFEVIIHRHLREIDCSSAVVGGPAAGAESRGKSIHWTSMWHQKVLHSSCCGWQHNYYSQ